MPAPASWRQRDLPLPRARLRRAPLRPPRRARRRLAADRHRRPGVRGVAPAVAVLARGGATSALLVALGVVLAVMNAAFYLAIARLPLATVGGDRVPRRHRARRGRRAHPAQRGRPRARRRRRLRAHRRPARRRGARVLFAFAELRAVHALHLARPPGRQRAPGDRCGAVDRLGARAASGRPCVRRRSASARPCPAFTTRRVLGAARRRHLLVGHPVRHRPARDGTAAPRDVRADAEHPAGTATVIGSGGAAPDPRRRATWPASGWSSWRSRSTEPTTPPGKERR